MRVVGVLVVSVVMASLIGACGGDDGGADDLTEARRPGSPWTAIQEIAFLNGFQESGRMSVDDAECGLRIAQRWFPDHDDWLEARPGTPDGDAYAEQFAASCLR